MPLRRGRGRPTGYAKAPSADGNHRIMMPAMIRRSALLLLLVLATPLAMTAADLGKADGKLTVSGKSHKLTYAYAIEMTTDTREKFYKIFLTDVALTDKQIGLFPDVLFNEIKEGKIHAIRIGIDKSGTLDSTDVYDGES